MFLIQRLEKVYKDGLAKSIGVSNFNVSQMERILKIATVPIHNLQVECYLYLPQNELVDFCKKHNILFTGYCPIGSPGRFSCTGKGVEFKHTPNPLEDALVKKLAEKYHKTPAQILIRHLLQRGLSPIPKSVNEKRIKENWDIFDFELDANDFKQLNSFKNQYRLAFWDFVKGHPEDPFKDERN
uniref:Aldo_ket_red domain-containing protein n=1 Tax=Syphacia muris TaxID=451379 RepID=A0A158R4W3_9BILA